MIGAGVPSGFEAIDLLTRWTFDPLVVVAIAAAAWAYAGGLRRVRSSGRPFPRRWVAAWFGGLGAIALALVSPIDAYADALLWVHMLQHLLLTLVAPPLLALGAPITLALRASRPTTRSRWVMPVLRSRPVAFLAHPVVGWALFVGTPFAIHFSPVFDLALRDGVVHAAEHAVWLGTAAIFWWPIVGRDPMPHRVSHPARILPMVMAMPATSFAALALHSASASLYPTYAGLPAPWGQQALGSQRAAAVMMWLVGNLAMVIAMLVVAAAWRRDEEGRTARLEGSGSVPVRG
jgi:cytochrome c oxidase assembly factor CtaG